MTGAGAEPKATEQPAAPDAPVVVRATHAWRSRPAWIALALSLALGLAADLWSKSLAFERVAAASPGGSAVVVNRADVLALPPSHINSLVPRHAPVVGVPYLLEFRLVLNPGAVFGIGPGKQKFFVAFTAMALGFGLWMFGAWTTARDRWAHIAIGLVLAGGLGNLYDRLVYGCVRDFLHPLPGVMLPFGISWPSGDRQAWPYVSNVADALLLVGIGVLLVRMWGKPASGRALPAQSA